MNVKQFFLNQFAEKAKVFTNNQQSSNKKRKIDNENAEQSRITDFYESSKLSQERIHEINRACVKAFVICDIPWYVIENPFFIEFLKTLRSRYTPPSKETLSR